MTATRTLHAWGVLPWDRVVEIIGDAQAAWADYAGFHIGPCPTEAPPYSHLWAWSDQWRFRVRIDGETGIVAALGNPVAPTGAPAHRSSEVAVSEYAGIGWEDDGQIAEAASDLLKGVHGIVLTETLEPMPMTFVSLSTTR